MSFRVSAGRIVIADNSVDPEHIIFDSDEQLFIGTNFVSGVLNLPARTATWDSDTGPDEVRIDNDHTLDSVNSLADTVVGAFKVTVSGGGQGVANLGWFAAGGTYIHYWDRTRRPFADFWWCLSKAGYTFYASGGLLRLNERVGLVSDYPASAEVENTSLQLRAIRFDYKLFVGTFV